MKVVLSDGSTATVFPNRTVFLNSSTVYHNVNNDLFFALRGAGSSFAIVTEFLYTVYKTPETRPAVLLIWMETQADFDAMIQVLIYECDSYITSHGLYRLQKNPRSTALW